MRIGLIGLGNMGSAIAEEIKSKYQISVFDKDKNKTKNLSGIEINQSTIDLVEQVDTLILAVKPQDFDNLLDEIKGYVDRKLIVSIAAGISTSYLENKLSKAPVVRVMPNLPAKVAKGMICLCKGRYARKQDLFFVEELFRCLGETMLIDESLMDAATAVSGSGPGFFFALIQDMDNGEWEDYGLKVFIPKLTKAAQGLGFASKEAETLAVNTTQGSLALLDVTGLSPEKLRIQVTSKGGTTQAGLEVLQGNDDRLIEAVLAAKKRAGELAKKE